MFLSARLVLLGAFFILAGCAADRAPLRSASDASTFTLYLVRHAEKASGSEDPELTEAGHRRAQALADRLETTGLKAVWSTDFKRTRHTAAPIAERLGIETRSYGGTDLSGFAAVLTSEAQSALVAGHSNTTPQLAQALGADPGTPIEEAGEYDRLYVITIHSDGVVQSRIERYGKRTQPSALPVE